MPPKIHDELAATMLVEAIYATDTVVCAKYGVHPKTLLRARKRLASDSLLSGIVHQKRKELERAWAGELGIALMQGVRTLHDCFYAIAADPRAKLNPAILTALTGAFSACAEVDLTARYLDARIASLRRETLGADYSAEESVNLNKSRFTH